MSNSEIISNKTIVDTLNSITKDQQSMIESCIEELTTIKNSKKVTEANLKTLINVWRQLDALRELFYLRLLNSLKRGDMLLG
tara:strand:+ start:423 stop:668 length:246 start_codon:yes stop_codon:yes gene_type:complete